MNRPFFSLVCSLACTACGQTDALPILREQLPASVSSAPSGDLVIAYQTNIEGEIEPCG